MGPKPHACQWVYTWLLFRTHAYSGHTHIPITTMAHLSEMGNMCTCASDHGWIHWLCCYQHRSHNTGHDVKIYLHSAATAVGSGLLGALAACTASDLIYAEFDPMTAGLHPTYLKDSQQAETGQIWTNMLSPAYTHTGLVQDKPAHNLCLYSTDARSSLPLAGDSTLCRSCILRKHLLSCHPHIVQSHSRRSAHQQLYEAC